MRALAYPLALALVAVAGLVVAAAVNALGHWVQWMRAGGVVGLVGLVATGVAAVNLLIPRTCASEDGFDDVNRPVLSLAFEDVDGPCFRDGARQLAIGVVVGLAGSVAVFVRRSARDGDDGAPVVPSP